METETEEKTEFLFSELSDKAREAARNAHTSQYDYPYDDWWDGVYEDAVAVGKLLGISIDDDQRRTMSGKYVSRPSIYFSGFCFQGDGASFAGRYVVSLTCVEDIQEYAPEDEELLRLANELFVMQAAQRMAGLEYFGAAIHKTRNYSHSGTMSVEIIDWGVDEVGEPDEDQLVKIMRDFADWIYKQLETQYDYFHSEEYVDEELSQDGKLFDEHGLYFNSTPTNESKACR